MNLLTIKEVAKKLRISTQTLRRKHKTGEFPAIILPNGRYYYTSDAIERFLVHIEKYAKHD